MRDIIVIAHNIRSTHNIGSLFRTCEGFGVQKIIISGYSPYPVLQNDTRLPHIRDKLESQIRKTALGAEKLVPFEYVEEPDFDKLKHEGFTIIGLEQSPRAVMLPSFTAPNNIALLLGEEVEGIISDHMAKCDQLVEIPMMGKKESFNVSVAAGIALYKLACE